MKRIFPLSHEPGLLNSIFTTDCIYLHDFLDRNAYLIGYRGWFYAIKDGINMVLLLQNPTGPVHLVICKKKSQGLVDLLIMSEKNVLDL